jgi:hypothetical protein
MNLDRVIIPVHQREKRGISNTKSIKTRPQSRRSFSKGFNMTHRNGILPLVGRSLMLAFLELDQFGEYESG